jgi:hypothetical protein
MLSLLLKCFTLHLFQHVFGAFNSLCVHTQCVCAFFYRFCVQKHIATTQGVLGLLQKEVFLLKEDLKYRESSPGALPGFSPLFFLQLRPEVIDCSSRSSKLRAYISRCAAYSRHIYSSMRTRMQWYEDTLYSSMTCAACRHT